jgi:hypothetical protein
MRQEQQRLAAGAIAVDARQDGAAAGERLHDRGRDALGGEDLLQITGHQDLVAWRVDALDSN